MAAHERLGGMLRPFEKFEDIPVHPITGRKADYCWERPDGVREPRWRESFPKCEDPAKTWYSIREVSKLLGRHPNTIRLAIKHGDLVAHRPRSTGPGVRPWMISGQAVEDFVRGSPEPTPIPDLVTEGSAS